MFGFSSFTELPFCNFVDKRGVNYAAKGDYYLTGQNIIINVLNRILVADKGIYSYDGNTAYIQNNTVINSNYGTYSYVGIDALNNKNSLIDASSGNYSYSGVDSSSFLHKVILAENGVYSYDGQTSIMHHNTLLSSDCGTYSVTGVNADIGLYLGTWQLEYVPPIIWEIE